uniref:Alpha/beta-tubulin-N-acetyltransferase 9 n=1 Tax=Tachysurus fulvidraco TaxID=1234273 RepID=A0A0U3B086_TACFU|nr:N-acetyltransferase 9 [Tachysurus fulvidraco]
MRLNEDTLLEGSNVVLVPYNTEHVPRMFRYHQWMTSEELQNLTASEPLTLDQEYDMQRSWREDDDKCTFIVLDKQRWTDPSFSEEECMVGDVNLFLTEPSDPSLAELEIMIAGTEPIYRGRGYGKEVTCMMMHYGINKLGIKKYEVKIGLENRISVEMFRKLQFQELSVSEVFQEVTLGLTVNEASWEELRGGTDIEGREYRKTRDSRHRAKHSTTTGADGN